METPDPEVILPDRLPTVATRPFVRLCDPLAVTLPLHSTPLEPPSSLVVSYDGRENEEEDTELINNKTVFHCCSVVYRIFMHVETEKFNSSHH